ncbi:YdbC family protein [Aedoeadaptatus pacaensis]|uniref:YdbC family protein n=1 Tax=Aedoeadaptatus pacaensis TaxID=1776390 RepID=UPI000838F9BA|nr:PC4/YdbC family ssDNA-binding protein [Peptoniphilus pacaensis]
MAEFKFEIVEHLGVLSTSPNGWTKELNRVSYNGAEPKFDLRSWSEDHEKKSKGITLSVDEFEALRELIK